MDTRPRTQTLFGVGRHGKNQSKSRAYVEDWQATAELIMENTNNSRWWETYLVRYITGTVVGAVIVYILLWKLKIDLLPSPKNIQSVHLIILAALGFVFCYISSAPITLLHAVRFRLGQGTLVDASVSGISKCTSLGWRSYIALKYEKLKKFDWILFFVLSWMTLFGALLGLAADSYLWGLSAASLFALTYIYIIALKLYLQLGKEDKWQKWYFKLSEKRAQDSKAQKEYIESYRHLREHGNAFFIILLEVCLGIVLYQIATIIDNKPLPAEKEAWATIFLAAIIYWILSGAICWYLGNKLERYLVEKW
jgi:uncharacterized membrane protein YfcA